MTDTDPRDEGLSRRTLLKSVPMVAGLVSVGAIALPEAADAQTKLSHAQAKYQDSPKNGQQCATCLQFMAPESCKIVQSPISPQGWCQFYAQKTG